jgi:hypothetical protein
MFALMVRSSAFDTTTPMGKDDFDTSVEMGVEYDLMRMKFAIVSWRLPKEAFTVPIDKREFNSTNLDLLLKSVKESVKSIDESTLMSFGNQSRFRMMK